MSLYKEKIDDEEKYIAATESDDGLPPNLSYQAQDSGVQRRLRQRHVQMIAIAGTIGTGLFLGSGHALRGAGPLGALIAYVVVGTVAYSSLCSLGEMTTYAPVSGTFPHYASRWVDPALGFAVGWNYFYGAAIGTPSEISAAVILLTFWDSNTHHIAIYTAVVIVFIISVNIFGVRWFGEAEFGFSIIKISLILGLVLAGLIIDLGGGPSHERIGFRYWKNPGAIARAGLVSNINTDRFLGILSVLVQAAFSLQSMELVAVAASETESPRRNIKKAVRRVFWRIFIFYILGILVIGMLVSYDDPALLASTGTAAQSPFVIAMTRAGVKDRGMKAQGRDVKQNVYHNPLQPYIAYWGVFWTLVFVLVNGFEVFFNFTASGFLTSYLNIPIFTGLYLGYKIFNRTKIWKPEERDFVTGIPSIEETEIPELPPKNIWERIGRILF
ncbi:hypothetical protein H0H92_003325 [Tricholoma furcatifolium]|nr:hypothetical protein H0H92_003325 [Tricholoma furcatifolium]